MTCTAPTSERCGSSQQESKSTQCCTSMPSSLAYSSHKMRSGFSVCHSSTLPCSFHSFHSRSICQRARIKAMASAAASRLSGTLVSTIVHCTRSHWRAVMGLPCLCACSLSDSRRRLTTSADILRAIRRACTCVVRSEEHTSELQSHSDLVCRLLLEKKKNVK